MPNRVKRNSVVDMLAKVPVHRGSLLKGIENLLKTIESSENAVMIPTLLRDKCQFDAWELLFVAKILKASILGHIDLVEFYMSHINQQQAAAGQQASAAAGAGTPTTPTTAPLPTMTSSTPVTTPTTTNGYSQQSNNSATSDGLSIDGALTGGPSTASNVSPSLSSTSSQISSPAMHSAATRITSATTTTTSGSSASWVSANCQQPTNGLLGSQNSSISDSQHEQQQNGVSDLLTATSRPTVLQHNVRQAQPPSLLQLTTTNNHINSVVQHHQQPVNIELLASHLNTMQLNNSSPTLAGGGGSLSVGSGADNALLSISTSQSVQTATPPPPPPAELRTSRSAGCLFRLNSGASSPRTPIAPATPTTPYSPQAETLASNGLQGGLAGDPSAPVKLLFQIEQLKSSIGHVTSLLESVVELYKDSIDNMALA